MQLKTYRSTDVLVHIHSPGGQIQRRHRFFAETNCKNSNTLSSLSNTYIIYLQQTRLNLEPIAHVFCKI